MTIRINDLVEHIEFKYIGKVTSLLESDILHMHNGTPVGKGLVASIDVIEKGRNGDAIPNKTTAFIGNLNKIYSVTGEKMKHDRLNCRRVENWGKSDRTAFYATIGLLLCLLVAVVV